MRAGVALKTALVASAAALLLSGCGWLFGDEGHFRDREGDYREARPTAPPAIPADLDGSALNEMMFIPEVAGMDRYLAQREFELPRPATLFAREEDRSVRIQRFGSDAWIVAPDPPPLLWPRILQFLADNGISVDREVPEQGILETEWLEISADRYRDVVRSVLASEASDQPYHRLRLQVSQAVRHGATEITLQHVGEDTPYEQVAWGDYSTVGDAPESTLLSELAGYIAAEVAQGGVSLLAQNIATTPKAEVMRVRDEPPALRFRLPYERTWATIGSALSNAEIEVLASDSAAGEHRILFDESQFQGEEPGWFRRTFSFLFRGGRVEELTLRLVPAPDGHDLHVFDAEGEARPATELAEDVLRILREFAS